MKRSVFYPLLVLIMTTSLTITGQDFSLLKTEFTLKEKNTVTNTSQILKGTAEVNNIENQTIFYLTFPNIEKWIIKDTFLYKYYDDTLISTTIIGEFNQLSVFNSLPNLYKSNFELKDQGFTIDKLERSGNTIVTTWKPGELFAKFIKHTITTTENNLLTSVNMIDIDDKPISVVLYANYQYINERPIPHKISTKIQGTTQSVFRTIELNNVSIH